MDVAKASARAYRARQARRVDLYRVQARQIERETAIVRDGAPEGRGRGSAHRDRHALRAGPSKSRGRLGRRCRLEDEIRNGARQDTREQRTEIDVLIAIRLRSQYWIGDDPVVT